MHGRGRPPTCHHQSSVQLGARGALAGEPACDRATDHSWVLDAVEDTVPPKKIVGTETEVTFHDLEPGHHCFYLRAVDHASDWGPATHVVFDLTAPE
ncbi:MAG: hypothetical protein ACOCZ7_02200 [Armatimonadota bacterium]